MVFRIEAMDLEANAMRGGTTAVILNASKGKIMKIIFFSLNLQSHSKGWTIVTSTKQWCNALLIICECSTVFRWFKRKIESKCLTKFHFEISGFWKLNYNVAS